LGACRVVLAIPGRAVSLFFNSLLVVVLITCQTFASDAWY